MLGCGRSSPIWVIPKNTGDMYRSGEHLDLLARPKLVHPEYLPRRDVRTIVPKNALLAKASDRLDALATPRVFPEGPFRDPIWQVRDRFTQMTKC